jgi:SAM-dependent methyltransferase
MARAMAAPPRFEDVTETTGTPVTPEARQMIYTRYAVAAEVAAGRRTLELACGGGSGLGLVGAGARSLVGGDYSRPLLHGALAHYGRRIPLARLSAEALPFRGGAFEVVLFFEATYYVPDMERAFDEVVRVLAPHGTALFVNANPERPDFITSPFSVHYHTADEFRAAFERRGLDVTTGGAFPIDRARTGALPRAIGAGIGLARLVLRSLGLVPRTLRGRARLKRLLYRDLTLLPAELPPGFAEVEPRVAVPPGPVRDFKVIYVTARKLR